jgi:hypothetical protein
VYTPGLRPWLAGLDSTRAVHVTRALLLAEAGRLNLDLKVVRMTGNVTAKDGGVDGRTDFPAACATLFPKGPWTWQIKTGGKPDVSAEVSKVGVQQDIKDGRDYVMVWLSDLPSTAEVASAIEKEVKKCDAGRSGELLTLEGLERLAEVHPAVVQEFGGPSVFGLTLRRWGAGATLMDIPFKADDERRELLESIRQFAQTADPSMTHLHVFGDTGVGKSRLVFRGS